MAVKKMVFKNTKNIKVSKCSEIIQQLPPFAGICALFFCLNVILVTANVYAKI